MPPKKFERKFGIPSSHSTESQLTAALYRLPESVSLQDIENITKETVEKVNKILEEKYDEQEENKQHNEVGAHESISRSLSPQQIITFRLKLVRHFEDNGESENIDMSTFVDALVESPKFLNSDKGSISKLFEIHQVKTLQKIAELRRRRAEMTGDETFNPYENLFETTSGHFYLARLLNMPHLEQESEYMDHCVGTSTSYVSKIKRGEVEIFSFRDKNTDTPVVTIEYDVKRGRLLQVKGLRDKIPTLEDSFSLDLLDALEKLSTSINDQGEPRAVRGTLVEDMKKLLSLKTKTERKEDLSRDELLFLYEVDTEIVFFDIGRDPLLDSLLSKRNPKDDYRVLCDCPPQHIAKDFMDINEQTIVFLEDDGKKITLIDFREEKHKSKIPQLLELAKTIKATGSHARPDMSFLGGIIRASVPKELLKDRDTAFNAFKEADSMPDYIWPEWGNVPFTTPEKTDLDFVIFSYNGDEKTSGSSDKIVADMKKLGYRPPTLEEMVLAGIAEPQLTKNNSKYFVGLTKYEVDGDEYVPGLVRLSGRRGLVRDGWALEWRSRARFLAVRI